MGLFRASIFLDTVPPRLVSSHFCDEYALLYHHAKFGALITFSTSKTFTKQSNNTQFCIRYNTKLNIRYKSIEDFDTDTT